MVRTAKRLLQLVGLCLASVKYPLMPHHNNRERTDPQPGADRTDRPAVSEAAAPSRPLSQTGPGHAAQSHTAPFDAEPTSRAYLARTPRS